MDCKSMQKSLKTIGFRGKFANHPLKTARKSTNSEQRTIRFLFFFRKNKVEPHKIKIAKQMIKKS